MTTQIWKSVAGATVLATALALALPVRAEVTANPAAADVAPQAGPVVQSVEFAYVKEQVVFPAKPDVTIVDTRRIGGGFDADHIPGAINIPADRPDLLADQLPADRKHQVIFYCEDARCPGSTQAAREVVQRGYENARVYAAGYADWRRNGGGQSVSGGHIIGLKKTGARHTLIDSRHPRTAAKGMIPGAISIPDAEFDQHVAKLPVDKNALLIFYCGGIDCPLSSSSMEKARKLGYNNVRTFPEGYPEWMRLNEQAASPGN